MNQSQIHQHVQTRLPSFSMVGNPISLGGGLLNYVWRIPGKSHSLILKYAPPFVATNPEIALSQTRIEFEAKAMRLFAFSDQKGISNEQVRLPFLWDYDPEKKVLLMEDVGQLPDLVTWLSNCDVSEVDSVAQKLGAFLARLHTQTSTQAHLAKVFHNQAVQLSRLHVQYNLYSYCKQANLPQAQQIADAALSLGNCLQTEGQCVIMGDLWPPSILVQEHGLRIIDWEFSHFGWPVQDIAHLIAHLWMRQYLASNSNEVERIERFKQQFLTTYQQLRNPNVLIGCTPFALEKHLGAEVLMRTIGPFRSQSPFKQYPLGSSFLNTAIETAIQHFLYPKSTNTFGLLHQ